MGWIALVVCFSACFSLADDAKIIAEVTISHPEIGTRLLQIREDEDSAIVAFRTAEENNRGAEVVFEIAKQLEASLLESDPTYKLPAEFYLKTVGKYIRRSTEISKDGFYDEAAHDIIRAMLRKGIESDTREKLMGHLQKAIRDLPLQRRREAKEREEEMKALARKQAEEEALAEGKVRQEIKEADWARFLENRFADEAKDRKVLISTQVKLESGDGSRDEEVELAVKEDQSLAEATLHFCVAQNLDLTNAVHVHSRLATFDVETKTEKARSSANHIKKGQKYMDSADFFKAATQFLLALVHKEEPLDRPTKEDLQNRMQTALDLQKNVTLFETDYKAGKWAEALEHLRTIQQSNSNKGLLLMKSRCYEQLGKWQAVIRETGFLIQKEADYSSWKRGQPRMMAAMLGAQGAMEMGNIEKALKFYKSVLKFDPEQKEIRKEYKKLKDIGKALKDVDNHLEHSRNHRAVNALEDILSLLRGMQVSSLLFRSGILLKLCRAQSGMQLHEQALTACNQAVDQRSSPLQGSFKDISGIAEALKIRATAHANDNNHDDAVSDLRQVVNLFEHHGQEKNEAEQKLREASHKQKMWNENRDHKLVLKLPINLGELSSDKQCHWVKRQYKKLAKKWHPDKYKGDKIRAQRKMVEVADSKAALFTELRCKGR